MESILIMLEDVNNAKQNKTLPLTYLTDSKQNTLKFIKSAIKRNNPLALVHFIYEIESLKRTADRADRADRIEQTTPFVHKEWYNDLYDLYKKFSKWLTKPVSRFSRRY